MDSEVEFMSSSSGTIKASPAKEIRPAFTDLGPHQPLPVSLLETPHHTRLWDAARVHSAHAPASLFTCLRLHGREGGAT